MPQALKPRKLPRQARAVATVDAIVVATTQLLKQGPFARASSARIAQRAGVSVGSV
jgi:AcrR family transcriptional regulator